MKGLKRIALSLAVIVLASCSTKSIEIVHVDAECLGLPSARLTDTLSNEEIDNLTDIAAKAINGHIIKYQERIEAQCRLIEKHNQGLE